MTQKRTNMWMRLLVISIGGSVIYLLPYLQYTFYDSMMAEFNFTNTQMGNIMSVYGSLNLIAYFIGGIIADRFSSRILITFSLIVTGLSGFWFATFPSYSSMLIISVIWSFATIFTYWPAVIKAINQLGESDVQGRLFGFREALNSLGALIFSSTGMWIFTHSGENIRNVVVFYSVVHIVIGAISFIFLPKDSGSKNSEQKRLKDLIGGLGYVLKNPMIWVIGFIIFFGYAVGSIMGRLAPYLTAVFKMSVATAGIVGVINTYGVGNIGAITGGLIADKMKSSTKFLRVCFVVMAILLVLFVAIPGKPTVLMAAIFMGLSVRLVQVAVRSVYFVPLDEARIPAEYMGTASGVVSVIGFLPDAFLFTVYGKLIDNMPTLVGYKVMFGSLIGFCVVGFILTNILIKMFKKKSKKA